MLNTSSKAGLYASPMYASHRSGLKGRAPEPTYICSVNKLRDCLGTFATMLVINGMSKRFSSKIHPANHLWAHKNCNQDDAPLSVNGKKVRTSSVKEGLKYLRQPASQGSKYFLEDLAVEQGYNLQDLAHVEDLLKGFRLLLRLSDPPNEQVTERLTDKEVRALSHNFHESLSVLRYSYGFDLENISEQSEIISTLLSDGAKGLQLMTI